MKKVSIERFLTSIGKSGGEWLQLSELKQIALNSDGNQNISYLGDRVKFDLENELVLIKKYKYELVSGKVLGNPILSSDKTKLIIPGRRPFDSFALTPNNEFYGSFRYPKIGDNLLIISENGTVLVKIASITSDLKGTIIGLDSEITGDPKKISAYYIDPEKMGSSSPIPGTSIYISYSEMTNNPADIYIDFAQISGLIAGNLI